MREGSQTIGAGMNVMLQVARTSMQTCACQADSKMLRHAGSPRARAGTFALDVSVAKVEVCQGRAAGYGWPQGKSPRWLQIISAQPQYPQVAGWRGHRHGQSHGALGADAAAAEVRLFKLGQAVR